MVGYKYKNSLPWFQAQQLALAGLVVRDSLGRDFTYSGNSLLMRTASTPNWAFVSRSTIPSESDYSLIFTEADLKALEKD